jgi:hypothetical protein
VDDRNFIISVMPFVPGTLLKFLGARLREGSNWTVCKAKLLDEYFPHFVHERLIRDLIVFNFHKKGQSLRTYVDQVFQVPEFLRYDATELQLVDRVVMNLHLEVLGQAAFLEKPRSLQDLCRAVGLIQERFSVREERDRPRPHLAKDEGNENFRSVSPREKGRGPRVPARGPVKCWGCGQLGHISSRCSKEGTGRLATRGFNRAAIGM